MNTSEFLMIASAIVPERNAIVFDGEEISFQTLNERAGQLANALSERGVGAGDRVAVMQVNTARNIVAYFATTQLDAIFVPINFRGQE